MTKSKRRGPRKIGRTRKARSRRYGGAAEGGDETEDTLVQQLVDQTQVALSGDMIIQEQYAKIGQSPYTKFGMLATEISGSTNGPKHDKIVALLYLIKYHTVEGDKSKLQKEFIDTVANINTMTQNKSAEINTEVGTIAAGQVKFGPIMDTDQSKADLLTYVNNILLQLKAPDAPVVAPTA